MSKLKSKDNYLANVCPRSKKHPRIQWTPVLGGTTASGWLSLKVKKAQETEPVLAQV